MYVGKREEEKEGKKERTKNVQKRDGYKEINIKRRRQREM